MCRIAGDAVGVLFLLVNYWTGYCGGLSFEVSEYGISLLTKGPSRYSLLGSVFHDDGERILILNP